jgi:NAD(P)-dependent dehydrogenase (short-subunit alcohol dehydrogenase family)
MAVAVITGGSRGLGKALASALLDRGWSVVIDGRERAALERAESEMASSSGTLVVLAGDVTEAAHRSELLGAAERLGGLDLLVNNASTLGATPLPGLARYPLDELRHAYEVNVVAPLALVQEALPLLRRSADARIVNVSSDAAVEPYEGWGGYGSSKAALDQLSAVLAAEEPSIRVWALDPGDMRTQMHQDAFPGEDISDRPVPEAVAPLVVALIEGPEPSGRKRAAEVGVGR